MISGISFSGTNNVINKSDATGAPKNDSPKKPCIMHNYTLTVPSYMDNEIETYCANKGIKFTKSTNKIEAAKDKIAEPEAPFIKAEINVEKFNELLRSQRATNVYHLGRNYDEGMKNKVNSILSDDEIPATTLSIKLPVQSHYTVDKTIDTLENKGIEGLDDTQLVISFEEQGEYDQYTYFAFSEAGIDKIPVYMDEETYKIAQAAGITE